MALEFLSCAISDHDKMVLACKFVTSWCRTSIAVVAANLCILIAPRKLAFRNRFILCWWYGTRPLHLHHLGWCLNQLAIGLLLNLHHKNLLIISLSMLHNYWLDQRKLIILTWAIWCKSYWSWRWSIFSVGYEHYWHTITFLTNMNRLR